MTLLCYLRVSVYYVVDCSASEITREHEVPTVTILRAAQAGVGPRRFGHACSRRRR